MKKLQVYAVSEGCGSWVYATSFEAMVEYMKRFDERANACYQGERFVDEERIMRIAPGIYIEIKREDYMLVDE